MLWCYTDQHNTHLFKRDRPISVRSQKKIYRKSTDKTNPHHYPTLTGITNQNPRKSITAFGTVNKLCEARKVILSGHRQQQPPGSWRNASSPTAAARGGSRSIANSTQT